MRRLKHLLLLSILIFSLFSWGVREAKADDWQYYKSIAINNFSENYPKKITVHYGSGTDITDEVHLNNHCEIDFRDVQFRANDQTTVLKHWREEYTASNQATFWVKLPSSSQTIYIYYGNSSATDGSDPDNVFTYFDDCESGVPTDYWTESNSEDGDVVYSTEQSKHGSKSMKATQTSTVNAYYVYKSISEDTFILEFWVKHSATNNYVHVLLFESTNQRLTARWNNNANLEYYTTSYQDTGYDYTTNWEFHRFTCTTSNDVIKWEQNSTTIASDAHRSAWTTIDDLRIFQGNKNYLNDYCYYDDIRIRKYVSPEPTLSFGSEQTTNSPPYTPSNSSPSNGATNQSLNPILTWSEYEDPDSDPMQGWEVRVDNNSDMNSPEWEGSGITGNSITINVINGDFGNDCAGQSELDEDETYYWDVRVQDDQDNWSDRSTATNFTTGEFSPYQPTITSPTDESTGISLNPTIQFTYEDPNSDPIQNCDIIIDDNSDFSSKEWWTGLMGGGAVTSIVVNVSNGTFYNNCSGRVQLDESTLYHVRVKVQDDEGRWSIYSTVIEFTTGSVPAAPTGCTATYVSDSQIDLGWTDNSSNETGFEVYRSVDSGGYSLLKTEPENSTGTNDTSVSADHLYQYKIRSYNDVGNSNYCETSVVATTPSAPSNVSANLQGTTITITWSDNSSITDLHEIERSIDGGDWTYFTEDSDGTAGDTWQEAWNSVKYRLRAKCSIGPRYSSWVDSNTLTSNQAPSADFSFWGSGEYRVSFDASASEDPDNDELTFSWDFGDGTEGEGVLVTHDYGTGGEWTATLTVSDGSDQDQIQKTVSINVTGSDLRPYSPPNSSERKPSEVPFEIIGKKTRESAEFLLENNLGLILIIIVVIVLVFAVKNK